MGTHPTASGVGNASEQNPERTNPNLGDRQHGGQKRAWEADHPGEGLASSF